MAKSSIPRLRNGQMPIKRVSTIMNAYFKTYASGKNIILALLRTNWHKIVGKKVAEHSIPVYLREKKLFVYVDDIIWIQELSLQSNEIIESIRKFLKNSSIEKIHFKLGEVKKIVDIKKEEKDYTTISPEIEKLIDEKISKIEDEKLRNAFKHYFRVISEEKSPNP